VLRQHLNSPRRTRWQDAPEEDGKTSDVQHSGLSGVLVATEEAN
jgi:hypothetical protein